MSYKSLIIAKFWVCVSFAPLLLFFPEQLLNFLGLSFGLGAALTAREYGAVLVGNAFLTWYSRSSNPSSARKAIVIYLFVYDLVALIAVTIMQLQGTINIFGWGVVTVYLFFTLGFGSLLLKKS